MHCLQRDTLLSELQSALSTEALKKVIEYAFTTDNVYRITTGCLAENIGSERVM